MALILASASPRRRELLESLHLDFAVKSASGDGPVVSSDPGERVLGHAFFKARALAEQESGDWILAADTLVYGQGMFFPKPKDRSHAKAMVEQLVAMGEHEVWTGSCLIGPDGQEFGRMDLAKVAFQSIPEADLETYLNGQEWADKAGAYAIQGWAGSYTELLHGEFGTVVGLSQGAVLELFAQANLSPEAFRR
ncbi:MAG: Maf-like protein [Planctomycetes bacterium]|nr:Maf-like protein [Planctomycetota bacterium]MCP4771592.1 Maf-like protein [Planctomycetota bacterium]MCP4860108.1 Maf-like protein [Planctomycetota bacterium]